jgi:2-polyprenyl-3-methyl-5-hydroxy-6-metoxy-1,4-benzoquinol methylase
VGIDIDEESLQVACVCYPEFRFEKKHPRNEQFDTIVLLAVIEHIKDPESLLTQLQKMLRPNGRIVVTTPHPSFRWLHWIGSRIGLFSLNASAEHEQLIDYNLMKMLALKAGLVVSSHKRFLLGANQLFLLAPAK